MKSSYYCYVEVELFFRDGSKEWVSPVEDTDKNVFRDGGNVYIMSTYNGTYDYQISDLCKVVANRVLGVDIIESKVLYEFGLR